MRLIQSLDEGVGWAYQHSRKDNPWEGPRLQQGRRAGHGGSEPGTPESGEVSPPLCAQVEVGVFIIIEKLLKLKPLFLGKSALTSLFNYNFRVVIDPKT